MSKLRAVPITNVIYSGHHQAPYTLILLQVEPSHDLPKRYDIELIFRGFADVYRFETCISTALYVRQKPTCVGGYNSLALRFARNGHLQITPRPSNPYRVRLTFRNQFGLLGSILVPKNSVMPFFHETDRRP
ncbi:hypothetical protein GF391_00875 [Candidatus Uhrbacteria bacterium]|nr:hypothetical protein [Candidatus Uhrbacteria bacterium]